MLSNMKKGDKVILSSGLYGTINKTYPDRLYVKIEIADKLIIQVRKEHVAEILGDEQEGTSNKKDKGDKSDKKEIAESEEAESDNKESDNKKK